ncbi:MAG: hypothetical protein COT84_03345 [Chlamydiae bacterium CG10_big_fil_rev_8_21_14_0_10_35_9]|nr:MAG: hypothetical protein COT84_03345 [Chlamydiae bacterium CG10_big_fil_rev_8_21_14_0_10_35_9]
MSVQLHNTQITNETNIQDLYRDANTSIFDFLDLTSLARFGTASSKTLKDVTEYKIQTINSKKIESFIEALHAALDPTIYGKERQMLEKISVQVKEIPPRELTLLKVKGIKNSILEALKSLDRQSFLNRQSLEILKSIQTPMLFENLFEVLEIYIDLEAAKLTRYENYRNESLTNIAKALCTIHEYDKVREVADLISDKNLKSFALRLIVETLAKVTECDRALEFANVIPDEYSRSIALEKIANAFCKANEYDSALKIANQISHSYNKNRVFKKIAEAFCEAKEYDKASKIANLITVEEVRSEILYEIEISRRI